jgi:hypothetical protein
MPRPRLPSSTAALLLSLIACGSGPEIGGGSGPGAPASAAGPASPSAAAATPAAAAGLPDLRQGTEKGQCETIKGNTIPGADSYFFGELQLDGAAVSGTETWSLAANAAWIARGGKDCSIRWRLTGKQVPVTACGDCDFGLEISAAPDLTGADCPEDLVKREARPQELRYDIKKRADGTALVYFSKSGRLLGEGYHADGALNYRSQHQCKWF